MEIAPIKADSESLLSESQEFFVDFKDVRGQQTAKPAIEIACAGGHNILMIAARLGQDDARQAHAEDPAAVPFRRGIGETKIHSVAGVLDSGTGWSERVPAAPRTTRSPTPD